MTTVDPIRWSFGTFSTVSTLGTVGVVLVASLLGCAEPPVETEPAPRPVRTDTAVLESSIRQTIAGVTKTRVDSRLSFRVSGTIVSLPVEVGQEVNVRQVLARLDPSDFELEVERAQAALAQVQAGLRQADAEYERVRGLYESDNASLSDLEAARASADSFRAQEDAARKALEQGRRQVSYTTLRAPESGRVAALLKEINELTSPGETVVRLTAGSLPEVEIAVPDVTIPLIRIDMPAQVRLTAVPGETFPGKVSEVGVATAEGATTYPVTVVLDDADSRIRPGMAADVVLALQDSSEAAVTVPVVAVGEDTTGTFVFVVAGQSDGVATVERRDVTLGALTGPGRIRVLRGLEEGATVVTAGVRRLQNGMKVRVQNTTDGE